MGYSRIIQFGNVTELYEYEKNRPDYKERYISKLSKIRNKKARDERKKKGLYFRSKRHILRSTNNFFRICHHNNTLADTIHFLTLTFAYDLTYKTACRHVARFMERVKKTFPEVPIRYISVVERTKKNRLHFHLLVYNLPTEATSRERETRNFQRLFERGYVDLCFASYTSKGIAGYMAKYMAKALRDEKNETKRAYNCSRGIKKIASQGGNTLHKFLDIIKPTGIVETKISEYNVPYLGKCIKTSIINKNAK